MRFTFEFLHLEVVVNFLILILIRKGTAAWNITTEEIEETLNLLKYGTKIFIEQMSVSNWQLSLSWIKGFCQKQKSFDKDLHQWLSKNDISRPEFVMLATQVMETIQMEVETVLTSPAAKDWEIFLMKFNPGRS